MEENEGKDYKITKYLEDGQVYYITLTLNI